MNTQSYTTAVLLNPLFFAQCLSSAGRRAVIAITNSFNMAIELKISCMEDISDNKDPA
jgi:hypothetical protein